MLNDHVKEIQDDDKIRTYISLWFKYAIHKIFRRKEVPLSIIYQKMYKQL